MLVLRALVAFALGIASIAQANVNNYHRRADARYYRRLNVEPAKAHPTPITSAPSRPLVIRAEATGQTTAVTACRSHESEIECVNGDGENVIVSLTATPTGDLPAQYTDCHGHDDELFCVDPSGSDVLVAPHDTVAESESSDHGDEHDDGHEEDHGDEHGEGHEEDHGDEHDNGHGEDHEEEQASGATECHFHAGVEHCTSAGQSESSTSETLSCGIEIREYNIPLRIGSIFIMLVTSSIAVFVPILLAKLPNIALKGSVFMVVKQFGTGVIISVAFVHLYTHAQLMFTNECLGDLDYEATASSLVMAGIFLSFLVEFVGHRIVVAKMPSQTDQPSLSASSSRSTKGDDETSHAPPTANTLAASGHDHAATRDPTNVNSKVSVYVMESGILFHSILIGLTLVVAADSFYRTLLAVIVFHQFFEGLALGSRIALLARTPIWPTKFLMGLAFAMITPVGMAIGLGALNSFNGNDPSTLIAIGTLNSVSAGILVWVGLVDMWARDWVLQGGELMHSSLPKALLGGIALVAGLVCMSLLGKWA